MIKFFLRAERRGADKQMDTKTSQLIDSTVLEAGLVKIRNKELFENAPPYMIIRTSLKGGLYLSAGQTSK